MLFRLRLCVSWLQIVRVEKVRSQESGLKVVKGRYCRFIPRHLKLRVSASRWTYEPRTMGAVRLKGSDCHFSVNKFMYILLLLLSKVLGNVFFVTGENNPLSRRSPLDDLFGGDTLSTDLFLASASQDNPIDGFGSDGCTFSLEGCPLSTGDPSLVIGGLSPLTDGIETGGCNEEWGDCTSLFDDGWSTTSNLDILGQPVNNVDYVASGDTGFNDGTASRAENVKDQRPRIYYDCAPDYTSCIIHDRWNPGFQRKAMLHCPPDVGFGSDATATDVNSALFGLPGTHCEFCFENGESCELLDCDDVATFPSKNNNWGQPWGTCTQPSCSCANPLKASNDEAATQLAASSDDSLSWIL